MEWRLLGHSETETQGGRVRVLRRGAFRETRGHSHTLPMIPVGWTPGLGEGSAWVLLSTYFPDLPPEAYLSPQSLKIGQLRGSGEMVYVFPCSEPATSSTASAVDEGRAGPQPHRRLSWWATFLLTTSGSSGWAHHQGCFSCWTRRSLRACSKLWGPEGTHPSLDLRFPLSL